MMTFNNKYNLLAYVGHNLPKTAPKFHAMDAGTLQMMREHKAPIAGIRSRFKGKVVDIDCASMDELHEEIDRIERSRLFKIESFHFYYLSGVD